MNQSLAIERLSALDKQGRYVFSYQDIAKVFPEDSARTLKAGLNRLVKQGFLIRTIRAIKGHQIPSEPSKASMSLSFRKKQAKPVKAHSKLELVAQNNASG